MPTNRHQFLDWLLEMQDSTDYLPMDGLLDLASWASLPRWV